MKTWKNLHLCLLGLQKTESRTLKKKGCNIKQYNMIMFNIQIIYAFGSPNVWSDQRPKTFKRGISFLSKGLKTIPRVSGQLGCLKSLGHRQPMNKVKDFLTLR